jgi:serine/threonine-protein kinase
VATFAVGDIIDDRFRLLRPLGEGGFGEVYLAEDLSIDRRVAIKFLLRNVAAEIGLREAKAAGRVVHPNVVTIYDVGESEGRVFIAMEYVDGTVLTEFMQPDRLTLDQRLRLIVQLGLGLHAAHQAEVIHRDIKPKNLIVSQSLLLKIVDFGIARAAGTGTIISTGQIVGSLDYMAPEQLDNQEIDLRTDIFCASVVAYELLACRRAYQGGLTQALRRLNNTSVPPLPDRIGPLARSLDVAIKTGLARDRRYRYGNALKFAETFEALRSQAESEDTVRVSTGTNAIEQLAKISRSAESESFEAAGIAPAFGATTRLPGLAPSRNILAIAATLVALVLIAIVLAVWPSRRSVEPLATAASAVAPPMEPQPSSESPDSKSRRQPLSEKGKIGPEPTTMMAAKTVGGSGVQSLATEPDPREASTPVPSGASTNESATAADALRAPPEPAAPPPRPTAPAIDLAPVLQVLDAYAHAHQNRSAATLKKIHPSLTAEQLAAIDRGFAENIDYDFRVIRPAVVVDGDRATVSCTIDRVLSAGGQRRDVSRPGRFDLERNRDGQWLVTQFRIQP